MIRDIRFRITGVELSGDTLRIHRDVVAVAPGVREGSERMEQRLGAGTDTIGPIGISDSPMAALVVGFIGNLERLMNTERAFTQMVGLPSGGMPANLGDDPDDGYTAQRPGGSPREARMEPPEVVLPIAPGAGSAVARKQQPNDGDMDA